MNDPRPNDARIDALFQAAREAPVPSAPPFARVRARGTATSTRWGAAWVLLPMLAGAAAAGSYLVVRAKLSAKETPVVTPVQRSQPARPPAPVAPPAVELPAAAPAPAVAAKPLPRAPIAVRAPEPQPVEPRAIVPAEGGPAELLTPPPPPSTLAEQSRLLQSGYQALKEGHAAEARARFDDYFRSYPDGVLQAEALLGSIRADQALGRYPQALQSLERALTVAPERRNELTVLEGELLLALGRKDDARAAFDRALALGLKAQLLERATRGREAAAR